MEPECRSRFDRCRLHAPIVETTRDELDALPLRKVAATLGVALTHTQIDLREPTAILIGAEADGLPDDWLALADVEVEIPMSERRRTR